MAAAAPGVQCRVVHVPDATLDEVRRRVGYRPGLGPGALLPLGQPRDDGAKDLERRADQVAGAQAPPPGDEGQQLAFNPVSR